MPPKKRGIARTKKKNPSHKYVYVSESSGSDGEDEEEEPPCSQSGPMTQQGSGKLQLQKLSNAHPASEVQHGPPRQDTYKSHEQEQSHLPPQSSSSSDEQQLEPPKEQEIETPNGHTGRNKSKRKKTGKDDDKNEDQKESSSESNIDNSMSAYIPTSQQKHMRACMVCSIVRTFAQFQTSGCPNCESFLELINNPDAVQDFTSQVFEGLITVADSSRSWVARYQRLEGYVPGVYATQVEGVLPEEAIIAAENAGIKYIPRDGSASETLPVEQ